MALPEAVTADAIELGHTKEFEVEPVDDAEFSAGFVVAALGKHLLLPQA